MLRRVRCVSGAPILNGEVDAGEHLTGVSFLTVLSVAKRLELLSQLVPDAAVVGILVNPVNPNSERSAREVFVLRSLHRSGRWLFASDALERTRTGTRRRA